MQKAGLFSHLEPSDYEDAWAYAKKVIHKDITILQSNRQTQIKQKFMGKLQRYQQNFQ